MVKVTFTLDDATVAELRRTAERLKQPQSQVIRAAVAEFAARADLLTERERQRTLDVLERLRDAPATRKPAAVDDELRGLRADRRRGGRRSGR